jgi:hypothetical protein
MNFFENFGDVHELTAPANNPAPKIPDACRNFLLLLTIYIL